MKGIIIAIISSSILIFLIIFGYLQLNKNRPTFADTGIYCLANGHQNVAEHIHPILKITVDGVEEEIPADIGIDENCMSEIHTHDTTGTLHLESFIRGQISKYNLSHFFLVWNKEVEREGYNLEIIQDGEIKNNVEDVNYIDGSLIELKYTKQDTSITTSL